MYFLNYNDKAHCEIGEIDATHIDVTVLFCICTGSGDGTERTATAKRDDAEGADVREADAAGEADEDELREQLDEGTTEGSHQHGKKCNLYYLAHVGS